MTFFRESVELYLQYGNFLENLIPTLNSLNKQTRSKASLMYLAIFTISPEVYLGSF